MFLVLSIYAIADKMLLALKVNNQFAATWQLEIINYNTSSRDMADSQALSTRALHAFTACAWLNVFHKASRDVEVLPSVSEEHVCLH